MKENLLQPIEILDPVTNESRPLSALFWENNLLRKRFERIDYFRFHFNEYEWTAGTTLRKWLNYENALLQTAVSVTMQELEILWYLRHSKLSNAGTLLDTLKQVYQAELDMANLFGGHKENPLNVGFIVESSDEEDTYNPD